MCLGRLVDYRLDPQEKQVIARWFYNRSRCCLDVAFSKCLRDKMQTAEDVLPNGRLYGVLQLAFTGKNTNIETENNFARAARARAATSGRNVVSTNMCSKHVLAEAKRYHLLDIQARLPEVRQNECGDSGDQQGNVGQGVIFNLSQQCEFLS